MHSRCEDDLLSTLGIVLEYRAQSTQRSAYRKMVQIYLVRESRHQETVTERGYCWEENYYHAHIFPTYGREVGLNRDAIDFLGSDLIIVVDDS